MESWTEPDAKSAEIHWSLFSAAVTSHKTDHLLRPFPPMFISDYGEKDLDGLVSNRGTPVALPRAR